MERTAKVSFDFIDYNPTDKGMFGDNVYAEMNEHSSVFPTPDVPMLELKAANDTLKTKTQEAMSGDKVKIQERDAAEKVWNGKFRKEGEYVQRIASGDKLVIAQSGYHSTQTEVHPVHEPLQAELSAWGNKGKGSGIHAEIKPLAQVRGIVFVISTKPATDFATIKGDVLKLKDMSAVVDIKLTTKRKVDFTDLISGQTYHVTALGFNATGIGAIANSVEVIAP